MANTSDTILKTVLGSTLQGGALRMVLLLGVFAVLGAAVAWLVLR